MTDLLARILERARELPEERRDYLATRVLELVDEEIEERLFDDLIASRPDVLDRLAAEARRAWLAGETEPLDPETL